MTQKAESGLDIDLGNRCSAIARGWAGKTHATREGRPGEHARQRGAAYSSILAFGGQRLAITSDGIGTKIERAERGRRYDTRGWDLGARGVDDLAANGVEPTNLTNILDVDRLDERVVDELMRGLHAAASFAGIALSGGEIAELGSRIGGWGEGMHFNWCATAIGVVPQGNEPVDGSAVAPGDAVVAVRSRGFRSNGFSLVRKVMTQAFGERWHEAPYEDGRSWGEVLLTPSLVVSPLVAKLQRQGIAPHGIAHITGGGIPDKLGRVLRARGHGVQLDELWEPLDFMQAVQRLGNVPDERAYRQWNMGNAMLLIVAPADVEPTLVLARELGYSARRAGSVHPEPVIRLRSKSAGGADLSYPVSEDGGKA